MKLLNGDYFLLYVMNIKKDEDAENIIAYQYRRITSIIFVNEIFDKPDDEISQKITYVFCAVDELSNTMVPKM